MDFPKEQPPVDDWEVLEEVVHVRKMESTPGLQNTEGRESYRSTI